MGNGIPYENDQGEERVLSGKTGRTLTIVPTKHSWIDKRHPFYADVSDDEHRQRASFIATRKELSPFLVPHRFEGKTLGPDLPRAKLGYGLRLNQPFVTELFGHIRGAAAIYNWGVLSTRDGESPEPPEDGVALTLWQDVTGQNQSWTTFFERKVLEWLGTSPGGVVVVDGKRKDDGTVRPTLMFAPWSWVEDYDTQNLTYMRFAEFVDDRDPMEADQTGLTRYHLLYELDEEGNTIVSRWDSKGNLVPMKPEQGVENGKLKMGRFIDTQGEPRLPLVLTTYGEHPIAPLVGSGLLMGLDDIVIDIYNQMSEIREGYRDVSFGVIAYKGNDAEQVQKMFEEGSRFVAYGTSDEDSKLDRLAAESAEVEAGLSLVETSFKSWQLSARRKLADAMERATAQSGVSMKAEFQLDSRPLLVELTERLDEIESDAMRIVLQIVEGEQPPEKLATIGVKRNTSYNLEDEGDRIVRTIVNAERTFPFPAEVKARLFMRFMEESGLIDLSEEVDGPDGKIPLRELIERGARDLAVSADLREIQGSSSFGSVAGALTASQTVPDNPSDLLT